MSFRPPAPRIAIEQVYLDRLNVVQGLFTMGDQGFFRALDGFVASVPNFGDEETGKKKMVRDYINKHMLHIDIEYTSKLANARRGKALNGSYVRAGDRYRIGLAMTGVMWEYYKKKLSVIVDAFAHYGIIHFDSLSNAPPDRDGSVDFMEIAREEKRRRMQGP